MIFLNYASISLLILLFLSIGITAIAYMILLIKFVSSKTIPSKSKLFLPLIVTLTMLILLLMFSGILKYQTRNYVVEIASKCKNDNCEMHVDGVGFTGNKNGLLDDILRLKSHEYHNSHPEEIRTVSLIFGLDRVEISLARDSQYKDEYWVYYPKFYYTRNNDVGTIQTKLLGN